jgi:hypothetical protein
MWRNSDVTATAILEAKCGLLCSPFCNLSDIDDGILRNHNWRVIPTDDHKTTAE